MKTTYDVANSLRNLREEKSAREGRIISQKEVAEAVYMTSPNYSALENGRSTSSLARWVALADYYGVSLDRLIGRRPDGRG